MDIALLVLGFLLTLVGILGSFLPVIPGPPLSWVGLLLLYLTKAVPEDWTVLGISLGVAVLVLVMDYVIPALGTKKFGGTRAGMAGSVVGLIVAITFPVLGIFGIVVWPFFGALVGELLNNGDRKTAFRAAFGSLMGFLTGTLMKFTVTVAFFGLYVIKVWEYREALLPFLFES